MQWQLLQTLPPGHLPVLQQFPFMEALTSPDSRSKPLTAPAATSAPSPSRPRKPRRDTLTLVAVCSANRLIFSNMTDLLYEKRKREHLTKRPPPLPVPPRRAHSSPCRRRRTGQSRCACRC